MRLLPPDELGLQRALELAREAAAFASPNPTVGCVLLRGDRTLAEGAHHFDAYDHAEIVALKAALAAGHDLHGATACVTLEPCSHHGRTGPCSDALIAAGISRCVVATVDPNPLVSGRGLARMREAGIDVILLPPASPEAQQARRVNDAFAFSVQHNRPFVTLKAALSVDGKLAPPQHQRTGKTPHWLTGPAARADVQQLRHNSDAILTGIGTVLADDPELTDRTGLLRRRPLLRVVLDSYLRIPLDSKLVRSAAQQARSRSADLLVLCTEYAPAQRQSDLRYSGIELLRLPSINNRLDLKAAFHALQDRQIRSVLVEGGSALNASLLRTQLADRFVLYFAERELGVDAVPFAGGGASPYSLQEELSSVARTTFPHGDAGDSADSTESEDIRISGYLHDPWANF